MVEHLGGLATLVHGEDLGLAGAAGGLRLAGATPCSFKIFNSFVSINCSVVYLIPNWFVVWATSIVSMIVSSVAVVLAGTRL